jgi:hypothetical protein
VFGKDPFPHCYTVSQNQVCSNIWAYFLLPFLVSVLCYLNYWYSLWISSSATRTNFFSSKLFWLNLALCIRYNQPFAQSISMKMLHIINIIPTLYYMYKSTWKKFSKRLSYLIYEHGVVFYLFLLWIMLYFSLFLVVQGIKLRTYILSHSTSSFLWWVFLR